MDNLVTRKRIRLPHYDYSRDGSYFVTICSKKRQNIFREIQHIIPVGAGLAPARTGLAPARTALSIIGQIADHHWKNIPNAYVNVKLDEWVIMPNHFHGIIIINGRDGVDGIRDGASPSPTLGQIIGSFKSKCAVDYLKYINENKLNVSGQIWQRSFYEHVIRNERSLNAIREYITQNPENREKDKDNLRFEW